MASWNQAVSRQLGGYSGEQPDSRHDRVLLSRREACQRRLHPVGVEERPKSPCPEIHFAQILVDRQLWPQYLSTSVHVFRYLPRQPVQVTGSPASPRIVSRRCQTRNDKDDPL